MGSHPEGCLASSSLNSLPRPPPPPPAALGVSLTMTRGSEELSTSPKFSQLPRGRAEGRRGLSDCAVGGQAASEDGVCPESRPRGRELISERRGHN